MSCLGLVGFSWFELFLLGLGFTVLLLGFDLVGLVCCFGLTLRCCFTCDLGACYTYCLRCFTNWNWFVC